MIEAELTFEKRANYFMTDEMVEKLWNHVHKRHSTGWLVMLGNGLFRGMRIGEIVAMNIFDFQTKHFDKVSVILQKSHIMDSFPMLRGFSKLLKTYVESNIHRFKDGFIFPFYSKKREGHSHIDTKTAEAMFAKWRKGLAKEGHTEFLEGRKIYQVTYLVLKLLGKNPKLKVMQISSILRKHNKTIYEIINKCFKKGYLGYNGLTAEGKKFIQEPKFNFRYRVCWHSCRRWFETKLHDAGLSDKEISYVMRYRSEDSVRVYIDPYKVWKKEPSILEDSFGKYWEKFMKVSKGQTSLMNF